MLCGAALGWRGTGRMGADATSTSLALVTPELAHGTRPHLVQGEKQASM